MAPLTALLLATPLFGLSLNIDPSLGQPPAVVIDAGAVLAVQVSTELEEPAEPTTADLLRQRNKIKKIHKWFGISTWSMMTVTLVSGLIQFYNQYGWWQSQGTNPCVRGDAVFGQGQCSGTPTVHLTLGVVTGALYFTTFGLSFAMPDPLGVSEGNSDFARKLRTHKILRWVTFAGMLAQISLGVVIANGDRFGIDRANNYKTLRALATTHLALGTVTWGALTWAGSIMLF
ncbi:MAG: hypothetical protein O7F08_08985 [Deltaproteobacteria bacterium]|nr:hypothetical protein [Deltaproteobacteria bacterium]